MFGCDIPPNTIGTHSWTANTISGTYLSRRRESMVAGSGWPVIRLLITSFSRYHENIGRFYPAASPSHEARFKLHERKLVIETQDSCASCCTLGVNDPCSHRRGKHNVGEQMRLLRRLRQSDDRPVGPLEPRWHLLPWRQLHIQHVPNFGGQYDSFGSQLPV